MRFVSKFEKNSIELFSFEGISIKLFSLRE